MINPSNIDLNTLPWLPLEARSAFPKQAAIYFAIDSLGCVQYIGRSVNVHARWGSHHKYNQLDAIGSVKIAYLFVDVPELLPQIEKALIQYFQPALNGNIVTKAFRRRKTRKFYLDELVLKALDELARQKNVSVNYLVELHLFELGKEKGLISQDTELLGETRGNKEK